MTRAAVVAWKRVTRVLRRESSKRGGGVPAGFALIIPSHLGRKKPLHVSDPETSLAPTGSDPSSEWSLV